MKTEYDRTNWMVLALGIALTAGGIMAAVTYLRFEQETRSAEAAIATSKRLSRDLQVCAALRAIHEGNVGEAARRLDLGLCEDIVALNAQLGSADAEEQAFVRNAFVRFSLVRPKSARLLTDANQELRSDQLEAERILAQAAGQLAPMAHVVTVSP